LLGGGSPDKNGQHETARNEKSHDELTRHGGEPLSFIHEAPPSDSASDEVIIQFIVSSKSVNAAN